LELFFIVSEWPILLPGNGQNAGFYTIYPRASESKMATKIHHDIAEILLKLA
jgi:hypothetical protein